MPHRLGLLLHRRGRGGRHAGVHLAGLLLGQEAEAIPLLSRPGAGPAGLAQVCWTAATDKEFLSAFSQERAGGQPQGGREVKGGAKPPGWAGQGQPLSPEPAQGLLHKNISKENSALANGEIVHARITGQAGEGQQCPCAGVAPSSPSAALPKAHTHTQMLTMAQNK